MIYNFNCDQWEQWEIDIIASNYGVIFSSKISKEMLPHRSPLAIRKKARKIGLDGKILKSQTKPFDFKWSHKMGYLVGFIAADGNLYSHKGYEVSLTVHEKDKEILNHAAIILGGTIIYRPTLHCYTLRIFSKMFFDILFNLGIHPKKSLTLTFPNIPQNYIRDFVRGYFDGDGSVCYKQHKKGVIASFCGTKEFLLELRNILNKNTDISNNASISKDGNIYVLSFGKKDTIKLSNWIYYPNCLCLPRKRQVFIKARTTL